MFNRGSNKMQNFCGEFSLDVATASIIVFMLKEHQKATQIYRRLGTNLTMDPRNTLGRTSCASPFFHSLAENSSPGVAMMGGFIVRDGVKVRRAERQVGTQRQARRLLLLFLVLSGYAVDTGVI